jgi:hypothetical protein
MFKSSQYLVKDRKFTYDNFIIPDDTTETFKNNAFDLIELYKDKRDETTTDFTNIGSVLSQYYANRKGAQFVNYNWLNTLEVLQSCDLIKNNCFIFLNNELPCNNLYAINHYCVSKGIKYDWLGTRGNLLDSYDIGKKYPKNFLDDSAGTILAKTSKLNVQLFMTNMNSNLNIINSELETSTSFPIFKNIVFGLKMLNRTGNLVFRCDGIYTKLTISYIILLSHLFKNVSVINVTCDLSRYVVCKDYIGLTQKMEDYLANLIKALSKIKMEDQSNYGFFYETNHQHLIAYKDQLANILDFKGQTRSTTTTITSITNYIKSNNVNRIEKSKLFKIDELINNEVTNYSKFIIRMAKELNVPIDYKNIQILSDTAFNSPLPFHIDQINKAYIDYLPTDIIVNIVDLTANVGVDALLLARHFNNVKTNIVLVEKDKLVRDLLTNNFTNNMEILVSDENNGYIGKWSINDTSATDYVSTMSNVDLVYISPNQGGKYYKKTELANLYLEDEDISNIVLKLASKAKYMVIKIPTNFNQQQFTLVVDKNIDIIKIVEIYKSNSIDVAFKLLFIRSKLLK